jgi:N,N'-diacetyllegionaminate synthase
MVATGAPRAFIIAEAGVNHDGSVEKAEQLVRVAARAGADAVKFQTFEPALLTTTAAPKATYQRSSSADDESQFEMLSKLTLTKIDHRRLQGLSNELGIEFLSTPFDEESADFLESLGVARFKIGSGDLTNLPLLAHVAQKKRPLILSTGMATLGDVEQALDAVRVNGDPDVTLLHCVSNYPAEPRDVNLKAMDTLVSAFGVPVGYSDHTLGIEIALAAVARGAAVIEKHFTLDPRAQGPDHAASLDPAELESLVRGIRSVESALGSGIKRPAAAEADTARAARRSIVVIRDVPRGERLTMEHLGMRRPGTGLPPSALPFVKGRIAARDIAAGTVLSLEDLS